MKKKPNFFVVGDIKSASTSLYFYLKNHPEIFMPSDKELRFFSKKELLSLKEKQPAIFQQLLEDYLKNFNEVKKETAIGEVSPQYLRSFYAHKNIHEFNPNAKIIICIRNPSDRLYSLYLMLTRENPNLKFEDLVFKKDHEWVKGNFLFYDINNFYNSFSRKNIKIVLFENLKENPSLVMKEIYKFLAVDEKFEQNYIIHNKGGLSKFRRINFLINKFRINYKKYFGRNLILAKIYRFYKKKFIYQENQIDIKTKNFISSLCKQDILMTQALIKKNISHWIKT